MACSKRSYTTENLAVDALIEARIRFEQNSSCTVYMCEDCGNYHLTSRGELHPALKKMLDSGKIGQERRAFQWQQKVTKKY